MCTEKYLKEVWRFFECTPPQIQNIMVNFGVKSSPYWPARKKKLIILLENFNNYLSEAVVNKGVERVIDDLEITQASNLSLREAINCFLFNTVSKSYMKGILDKLNPQKAVGCDSLPAASTLISSCHNTTADLTDQ